MLNINAGSGQRPFGGHPGTMLPQYSFVPHRSNLKDVAWSNIDINERWVPDIAGNWNDLSMFADGSVDVVVSHQSLEHGGCGDADTFLREANRVLKPGGSLLIFIPDLRTLAERWLTGQISDYIYIVNLMGAYMNDEADRHRWHWTRESLKENLSATGQWAAIKPFDWRPIPGADIARDFWILGMESVK